MPQGGCAARAVIVEHHVMCEQKVMFTRPDRNLFPDLWLAVPLQDITLGVSSFCLERHFESLL